MKKYNYYKHDDSTDLIIMPINTIWINDDIELVVKALLYTRGYPGNLLFQDSNEWTIPKEDWGKWKLFDTTGLTFI